MLGSRNAFIKISRQKSIRHPPNRLRLATFWTWIGESVAPGKSMTNTRITAEGKYLAQCFKCGTWVEVLPEPHQTELFFEVLKACFHCCDLLQSATFTREKDTVDFH